MREIAGIGMRTVSALCLAILLAGFSPPQRSPESSPTQLVQPKSRIPGNRPPADPTTTEPINPAGDEQPPASAPFAQSSAPKASACTLEKGDFSPEFKAAIDTAQTQHSDGDLDGALKSVETASSLATSDLQRYLVDMLRGQIFKSMRNRQGYEAALRSLIERDCFLVPGEREIWQQHLDELTGRTKL